MLRNYLLVTLRNMARNKAVSVIHVAGLGLGIATFLLAAEMVRFEYSFDDFHNDRDRIFAATTLTQTQDGTETRGLTGTPPLYYAVKAKLPEVEYVARYYAQNGREPYCVMTYREPDGEEIFHNEPNARYVDPEFLKIFSFKTLQGVPDGHLDDASSIVITRSVAKRYFGDEDPIGKALEIRTGGPETRQTKFDYQVTAVLEDVPPNSSIQFEILLPFRNFEDHYFQDVKNIWFWTSFFTFIKTKEFQQAELIGAKLNALPPEEFRKQLASIGMNTTFSTIPFSRFHFSSDTVDSAPTEIRTANKTYTNIIGLIGLSILIVAGVNYINLTTARSLKRAREVGVRKVVGASRWQLARQFLFDAFVANVLGVGLGLTLLQLASPVMTLWTGYSFDVFQGNVKFLTLVVAILFVSTLLSGFVPAAFLASFDASRALKGVGLHTAGGRFLRKSLVIFQFVVSVGLVVFTFVIFLQTKFLRSKDKGFEGEQRVVIHSIGTEDYDFTRFNRFKERIEGHPKVIGSTASMFVPGSQLNIFPIFVSTREAPDVDITLYGNAVDYDFSMTMGVTLRAGREFTEDHVMGEKEVFLNETAVRKCGFKNNEDAVGRTLRYFWSGKEGNMDLKIIGVVADFNMQSTGINVLPHIYQFRNTAHPYGEFRFYTVHIAPGALDETLEFLRKQWNDTFDRAPFSYTFLDQNFQKVFEQDEKTQLIAGTSTILSILIACMGLGGLVSFTVGQRVKEIGIRKVLGASISRILLMLSSDFVRSILIAIVLALPIAWLAVDQFLQNYEYRIQPSMWMFVTPCIGLLLIAIGTITYQTMKAARSNPVDALKYE